MLKTSIFIMFPGKSCWLVVWYDAPNYELYIAPSPLARSPRSKSITDNADATDLFFTDFVFMWIDMRLYGALIFTDFHYSMDYLRIISCWGISSAVRAQEKIRKKKQDQVYLRFRKSVKKIKSVASVLSVSHFERVRTEPKAKEHYNVVLSSRQPISACL